MAHSTAHPLTKLPDALPALVFLLLVAVMAYWGGIPQHGLGLFALGGMLVFLLLFIVTATPSV